MNKTLFTLVSALTLCGALFMACEKTSNTTTSSTTTSTSTTSGGTTGAASANTIMIDGTSHTVTTGTNVIGSSYLILSNSSSGGGYPSVSTTFTGTNTPTAGTYTANANPSVVLTPTTSITWTVVSCNPVVTSGSSRAVSFTNATFTDGTSTHTVSVNFPF